MCSPQHSKQDYPSDPSHSHPQTQPMEQEPQNPQIPESPRNQDPQGVIPEEKPNLHHQEGPKSSLEENPDHQSSGKPLVLPIPGVDVPHSGGDMFDAPLISQTNPHKRLPKRKKGKCNARKQQAIDRRLNALLGKLRPIPFIPSKILDFCSHEKLLKGLGLWEFVHIGFNTDVRVDLIAQLVATYDPKSRRSCVNGEKIGVSRADLARALRLPVKKEKGDVVNLDVEAFCEESIGFIEDFVSIWVLLHDDTWMMPNEVLHWIRVIKDGSPEKVDWAGLVWFMVEKELTQGEQLGDCYYAVHFQYLIKSQREELFFGKELEKAELGIDVKEVELEKAELGVDGNEVELEKAELGVDGNEGELEKAELSIDVKEAEMEKAELSIDVKEAEMEKAELSIDVKEAEMEKAELGIDVKEVELGVEVKELEKAELGVEVMEEESGVGFKEEELEKADFLGVEIKGEENGDVKVGGVTEGQDEESVLREPNIELSLGQDMEKTEEVNDAVAMDVEEHIGEQLEEEEQEQWQPLDGNNDVLENNYLRLCTNEAVTLDDHEEEKDESEDLVDEEGVEGDYGEEQVKEDGFTGIFLQTREASQIPFYSNVHLPDQPSIELVSPGTDLNTSAPSFACGSKREVEHNHDDDIAHQPHGSNKRLKIEGPSNNIPSDFGTIMGQMQQWMTKARTMYEEKERTEEQLNIHKQILLDECHRRDAAIAHLQTTTSEELQKRDNMIYRLERELFMMGNIVEGYKKALKDTHKAFAEYRQRIQLPEEPIYKDAGPGGLVLSTAEIEKLRIKQEEEYKSNCLMLHLKAEEALEDYTGEFEMYMDKVNLLGIRLMSISSNVVELKEMYAKRRKNLETHQRAEGARDATAEE
nr:probable serine/threonine-protein kinase kinX isoform X1 [Ipomoea batatas]